MLLFLFFDLSNNKKTAVAVAIDVVDVVVAVVVDVVFYNR